MPNKENILVTGGAGFIGANYVHCALDWTDATLVVIDKLTYAGHLLNLQNILEHPRVHFIQADIADRTAMERVFKNFHPTSLLNFAAESHVDRSIDNPQPFIDTNIVGTFVLLETTRQYLKTQNSDTKSTFRFLHVSTDEVYGSLGETGLFSEDTPYAPNTPYAATKAGADHLVRAYFHTYGLPTIITNCSNNYGPFQFPEKLIPLMLLNAIEGKPLPIYGKGQNIRDWLYVEDHCEGLFMALNKGRPGEKYNLGGSNERNNLQTVDSICRALNELYPAEKNPALTRKGYTQYQELKAFVTDRPGHDLRYAIDATKSKQELGWTPKHDFDSGLRRTIQWYLDNRDWCKSVLVDNYERERLGLGSEAP